MLAINDKVFLKALDKSHEKEIYARITLLTFDEQPIEYIEGKVNGGSISKDGASSVRSTCNLTMVTQNVDINIYYLGIERKFKLELGLKNNITDIYPEIIWFNMGLYVTTSLNTARQPNSYTISIQGKDKMALLNGDLSGNLPMSVDFGTLEEVSEDGKTITYTKVPIKDIIYNAVETYGNEMPHNIIINDIQEKGLELLEYRGDSPVYLFIQEETNQGTRVNCINFTLDDKMLIKMKQNNEQLTIKNFEKREGSKFYNLTQDHGMDKLVNQPTKIIFGDKECYIAKITYGQCIGYRETELVYAGDLIANIGETVTSVLDKIKNMLGDYEYFYDNQGRFIFQQKKVLYEYSHWQQSTADKNSEEKISNLNTRYYNNTKVESNIFYNFEDNELITSFNNTPNLNNIKNDYSIWGKRKGLSGTEIPIHLRYAIEQKPQKYVTYMRSDQDTPTEEEIANGVGEQWTYIKGDDGSYDVNSDLKTVTCDWREILYQMAADYHKYKDLNDDFFTKVRDNNKDENGVSRYPTGRTDYEQYYTDILGFWRDIFTINQEKKVNKFFHQVLLSEKTYKKNTYYTRTLYTTSDVVRFPQYEICKDLYFSEDKIYYEAEVFENQNNHFHPNVNDTPENLPFWIDFLDTTGPLGRFATRAIGQRTKSVNDDKITSIYYRKVPGLIFVKEGTLQGSNFDYTYVYSNQALENCFVTGTQAKNAWEESQSFLNQYARCAEQITFNAIPVYYLEPNVRIALKDEESRVNGEYLVDKITFQLTYNGTMSVTAKKIYDNIY